MDRLPQPTDTEDHRQLPVSLLDLKEHCRIEHDEQDRLLLRSIIAATSQAEGMIGTAVMLRSFDLVLDGFPSGTDGIEFPNPPIRSITSITYYDSNGDSQPLDSASYFLSLSSAFPMARLSPGYAWPGTQTRENAVTVRYVAGYASKPSAIPGALSWAIQLRAATLFANSEEAGIGAVSWGVISEVRMEEMIRSFKVMHV